MSADGQGGYQPYPAYKESGVEWLGEIPAHWNITRAKFLFERRQRPVREEDDVITAFRDGTVTLRSNRRTEGFTFSLKEIGYQGIRTGDLVVHAMDGFAGAIGVSDSDGKSSPVYTVLNPRSPEKVDVYYFAYLLRFLALSEFINSLAKGIRERSTEFRYKEIKELWLPCFPLSEQRAIAAFLDHKTAEIDTLIARKEQLIALLQEKRAALITAAVTRGLDPDVALKDSGVEWLGEIPAHWEVVRTKTLFKLVSDRAPEGNDYELISLYADIGVRPRADLEPKGNKASTTDGYLRVTKGDLVVNKLLAWMGAVGVSEYDGVTSPAYDILRATTPLEVAYYHYLFRTDLYKTQFRRRSRGIMDMRLRLYFDELGQIPAPRMPVVEQMALVEELERRLRPLDKLVSEIKRAIDILQEYRTALISAAVTGKIDVRGEAEIDGRLMT